MWLSIKQLADVMSLCSVRVATRVRDRQKVLRVLPFHVVAVKASASNHYKAGFRFLKVSFYQTKPTSFSYCAEVSTGQMCSCSLDIGPVSSPLPPTQAKPSSGGNNTCWRTHPSCRFCLLQHHTQCYCSGGGVVHCRLEQRQSLTASFSDLIGLCRQSLVLVWAARLRIINKETGTEEA